ncbi:MAG: UDP-3-O-(3-hydroxymyristoyl)glucosamine N-acyltransferase [Myxococcales bacterium]|nr:UDP-3-O-(3-hydroxymyristoyl)glucosamine N-acyltransferase [Myxococcales bacterium]
MSGEISVGELAALVDGTVVRGDPRVRVRRVMPTDLAEPDAITFVSRPKFLASLQGTQAAAVMLAPDVAASEAHRIPDDVVIMAVERPYVAYARAAQALAGEVPAPEGWHPSAVVEPGAEVAEDAALGPFVYVGPGAVVGAGAVLYPGVHVHAAARVGPGAVLYDHVVVRHGCRVGARCILHAGVVIGSDGFGFAQDPGEDGVEHIKIPQLGDVELEADVEIGANTCVDRGALGTTRIGRGTKIDNLVQIGHNVEIGPGSILVAQSGVAGSSVLGREVILGAQSGISGHLTVGDRSLVHGQAGVMEDLPEGSVVVGSPAEDKREFFKSVVRTRKLGGLYDRVKELERRLAALEKE